MLIRDFSQALQANASIYDNISCSLSLTSLVIRPIIFYSLLYNIGLRA
jgi:hypothetical protein